MKFKNIKEIKNNGVKKVYRVFDEENLDLIGTYSDLRESKKDVNKYIDECEVCNIIVFELQFIDDDWKTTKTFYYDYGKFVEIK